MNTDYRYQLESKRLTGHQPRKLTCPHCGKKKCFVRYVDTRDGFSYVADTVGKCDHQNSCGYHYKPSEYFRDNQWARPNSQLSTVNCQLTQSVPLPPFQPLPSEYVVRSLSPQSTFWRWLSTDVARRLGISQERLQQVYGDYYIGATHQSDVIFWQIDQQGLVHGGHIMQYLPDGHRAGYQGWTHVSLIRQGLLPLDWQLYQCLFGEHLLSRRPDARVCLVESEKTALVMALLRPQELWLATGGCSGLSPERVKCLRDRRVTIFPDSGCYQKWSRQMALTTGIHYNVSPRLECYRANTDLADLVLGEAHPP